MAIKDSKEPIGRAPTEASNDIVRILISFDAPFVVLAGLAHGTILQVLLPLSSIPAIHIVHFYYRLILGTT